MSLFLYLQMTAVGITENVKGDAKKFEIWYNAREEVYIIQVEPLTCPANQEPREPLGLFRVARERLPVRTRSTVFTRSIPQRQGLSYYDTSLGRVTECAGPRMKLGASAHQVIDRYHQKWLWLPRLLIAPESFVYTVWLSGGVYGIPVLIGQWERGRSYKIDSWVNILSMRPWQEPKYSMKVLAQPGWTFHLPSESQKT